MSTIRSLTLHTRRAAVTLGLGAAAVGATRLLDLLPASAAIPSWASGGEHFGSVAALGVVLLGLGIACTAPSWKWAWIHRLGLVPALAGMTLGGLALFAQALRGEPLPGMLGAESLPPMTAFGLLLGGLALGLQALGRHRGLLYAQATALTLLGFAGVAFLAHLYGLHALLAETPFTAVSFPGATALALAALGLLFAHPDVGVMPLVVDPTGGGASVRRLLPVTVLVVILLGALRVWGEARGTFPGALGTAIFAMTTAFLVGALIVWNALALRRAEVSLRHEQEIRDERQRQFRHAIVDAPIPILMFAEDGAVLQLSRTVEEVTGFAPGEIHDLKAWGRLVAGEEHGRSAVGSLLTSLEAPQEVLIRTRKGPPRTWRIRTSSLGTLADGRGAYVTMATDITEIRRAEERKNEFLAVLGHELRNPLAALAAGLGLQRRRQGPERQAELRDMMDRQVRHLRRLLDDLLDVSRISRGKIELQTIVLSLNEAIERVVEEHRDYLAPNDAGRISLALPPRQVLVLADPTRLHQILGNLLSNAVKYTPAEGKIWVTLEREESQAVVRVRDSGEGIAGDQIATIFDPFRQIDESSGRRGGLGLGLTLVRQLATMHGGEVTAASRGPGHGSTFTLRLPVAAAEAAPVVEPPAEPPAPTSREGALRLLVVDDKREVADAFAELLSLSGHETITAYDGEQALEMEARHQPQVVFLDLDLPDLDGRAVARQIRERRADPPLLVAVSGYGGESHLQRSREAGIDRHLVKPVDLDEALAILATVPRDSQLIGQRDAMATDES